MIAAASGQSLFVVAMANGKDLGTAQPGRTEPPLKPGAFTHVHGLGSHGARGPEDDDRAPRCLASRGFVSRGTRTRGTQRAAAPSVSPRPADDESPGRCGPGLS
jgi:hypothetical protein